MLARAPILLTCASLLTAQGETRWGQNRYVEYVVGTAPVIVSAPHGGDLTPPAVADRTYGVTGQDRRTQETAREFADRFAAATGRRPHLIISHLHRSKLDPNREIVEAAQGDPIAIQAWNDFHAFIAQARATVQQTWGAGIYIDAHGHSHSEGWIELGYALDASTLGLSDALIDQAQYRNASTIRALAGRPGISFPMALRGAVSLGGHLQAGGFVAVPSPAHPDPAGGNYFTGGFDVRRYGSRNGGTVDGVQIELPFSIREDRATRRPFVDRTVSWLQAVFPTNWGVAPDAAPLVTVAARDGVASETGSRAEFVVTRTGSTALPRTVPFVLGGSASVAADYRAPGLTAVIPAGASEAVIRIEAIDDALAEGDETIEVRLVGSTEIGAANRAEVLLLDDDGSPELAAHWSFDAASGNVATDVSGNGRSGMLENGAFRSIGRFGQAVRFDGVDDRMRVQDFDYASTVGGAASDDFTLSFWFQSFDRANSYRYVFSHGAVGSLNSLNVYFLQSTGVLRTSLNFANDITDTDVLDVGRELRDGAFHHYALSVDRDGLTRVWIDGAEEAVAHFGGDAYDPSGDVVIGGRSDLSASRFFRGALDEVQVFSRALSSAQIRALYSGLGSDAAVYPGTGEDLVLRTGVDGPLTGGPRNDVKRGPPGSTVTAVAQSPGGTFLGKTTAIVLDLFPTGSPPMIPGLPSFHVDLDMIVVTAPGPLTVGGAQFSVLLPPGFNGVSLMLQALALDLGAQNGIFAASNAHEIRLGP